MHNTLASSDYGLLDERTHAPRPNYWAALLWRRLIGTSVLDAGPVAAPNLHVYAHSLRGDERGQAVIAINTDTEVAAELELTAPARRYALTAHTLTDTTVQLNGAELALDDERLPAITGAAVAAGPITLPPASITFLAVAGGRY